MYVYSLFFFFFSSRRRHTRLQGDWSSDVCSSDLERTAARDEPVLAEQHEGEQREKQQHRVDLPVLQVVVKEPRRKDEGDDNAGRNEGEPIGRAGPERERRAAVLERARQQLERPPHGEHAGQLPCEQRADGADPGPEREPRGDEQEERRPRVEGGA